MASAEYMRVTVYWNNKERAEEECDLRRAAQLISMPKNKLFEELTKKRVIEGEHVTVFRLDEA